MSTYELAEAKAWQSRCPDRGCLGISSIHGHIFATNSDQICVVSLMRRREDWRNGGWMATYSKASGPDQYGSDHFIIDKEFETVDEALSAGWDFYRAQSDDDEFGRMVDKYGLADPDTKRLS